MTTEQVSLAKVEWENWKAVCKRLVQRAAVSEQDLKAPQNANSTQGEQLISAIRTWGNSLVALQTHEAKRTLREIVHHFDETGPNASCRKITEVIEEIL